MPKQVANDRLLNVLTMNQTLVMPDNVLLNLFQHLFGIYARFRQILKQVQDDPKQICHCAIDFVFTNGKPGMTNEKLLIQPLLSL